MSDCMEGRIGYVVGLVVHKCMKLGRTYTIEDRDIVQLCVFGEVLVSML